MIKAQLQLNINDEYDIIHLGNNFTYSDEINAPEHNIIEFYRNARQEEYNNISMLSRTIRRCHIHDTHPQADVVLLLQSHRTMCTHIEHGIARFHPTTRLRGEAHPR